MITISPAQTISEWQPFSFSVLTLTSGSNLITSSLQWQANGINISNEIASIYSKAQGIASSGDSADYRLVFSGSISGSGLIGVSASLSSHLTINPLITTQPSSSAGGRAILEGEGVVFGGEIISSSIAVSYHWYHSQQAMAGETNASLNIQPGLFYPQLTGDYYLEIDTASGSVTSNNLSLGVIPQGAIIEPFVWDKDQWR